LHADLAWPAVKGSDAIDPNNDATRAETPNQSRDGPQGKGRRVEVEAAAQLVAVESLIDQLC
jgi:hypothetical protein